MIDRTAIDTIKGYFYQFDYAILKLLELSKDSDTIILEGIEDVDIETANEETAVQCKYYAKTEYNHSKISKPIRLMLNHYADVKKGSIKRISYKLYGYFESGQAKLSLPINLIFLKENFLTYTEKKIKKYHYNDLGLSDTDLNDFLSLLTIEITALSYEEQLTKTFSLLKKQFGCNEFESEHFFYNNALKVIKDISVDSNISNRKISKSDFIKRIDKSQILFNEWYIKYKGENKLFAELRSKYFTSLNVSPFERFFIIEVPSTNYIRSELKHLIITISRKWSKLSKRETTPFCPYIYLNNIPETEFLELKKELYAEGIEFTDGFDYLGAPFNPKSLAKAANNSNNIKLKIINKLEYIDLAIAEISKTKEIYQFFINQPFYISSNASIKQINIQFNKITDIQKII